MKNSTKYWIGGAVVVLVILVALYFSGVFKQSSKVGEGSEVTTTTGTDGVSIGTTGGTATVTEVPINSTTPAPSLDRPLTFGANVSPEAQVSMKADVQSLVSALKKDPTRLDLWMSLGSVRKSAGDYKGAEEAWVYVSLVASNDEVSAVNLADLYTNFLKDNAKAEVYYRKAIVNRPDNIDNYRNLYAFYRTVYKTGTSSAFDTLLLGLKNNPNNIDLLVMLGGHYRESGNTAKARETFTEALSVAEASHNSGQIEYIQGQLNSLPQ